MVKRALELRDEWGYLRQKLIAADTINSADFFLIWRANFLKILSIATQEEHYKKALFDLLEQSTKDDNDIRWVLDVLDEGWGRKDEVPNTVLLMKWVSRTSGSVVNIADSLRYKFWQQPQRDAVRSLPGYPQVRDDLKNCVVSERHHQMTLENCFETLMRMDLLEALRLFGALPEQHKHLVPLWGLLEAERADILQDDELNRDVERWSIFNDMQVPASISRQAWLDWERSVSARFEG